MDINNAVFKKLKTRLCKCFMRKATLSTHFLVLKDTQCISVSNTEYQHNFCLFTRKLHRAALSRILQEGLLFVIEYFYIVVLVLLPPLFASHSPLLLFPFVLFDAVEQTAGDEGHGHEEDDG